MGWINCSKPKAAGIQFVEGPANPKDLQGAKKCDVSLLPAIATYHAAHAFVDGAMKYGPYNWRDNKVLARVYIAGAKRHIERWEAGEELATDSLVHNLGGVMACCAILLDAQTTGNLIDDRAKNPAVLKAMDTIDAACKLRGEAAKPAPKHEPGLFCKVNAGVTNSEACNLCHGDVRWNRGGWARPLECAKG